MKNRHQAHVLSFLAGLGDSIRSEVKPEGSHETVKVHSKFNIENTDSLYKYLLGKGMSVVVHNYGAFIDDLEPDCSVNLTFDRGQVELNMKVVADFESDDEANNLGVQCRESIEKVQGLIQQFIATSV